MTYLIEYAYFCRTGKVRMNNEDNYWCLGEMLPALHEEETEIHSGLVSSLEGPACFAVFDGMGGESCGEYASYLGAEAMGRWWEAWRGQAEADRGEEPWLQACRQMNHAVLGWQQEHRVVSMGSTLAAVLFQGNQARICNLGDSRIYVRTNGQLSQLSTDHVVSHSFYGKAPLTQYLGLPENEMELEPSVAAFQIRDGMSLLLCTDGVTDMIPDTMLGQILERQLADPGTEAVRGACEALIAQAMQAGGRDNATAVLCRIRKAPGAGSREDSFFRRLSYLIHCTRRISR